MAAKVKYKTSMNKDYDPEFEKTVYDPEYYADYDDKLREAAPYVRRFFIKEMPPFQSIVDFGTGSGELVKPLLADGKDVLGVDFSDGSAAINVLGQENFLRADLTKPVDFGREFDVLMSLEVYEHIPPGEPERGLLDNIKRVNAKWMVISCAGMKAAGADTGALDQPMEKQWGRRHYNCLDLKEFASRIMPLGYVIDGLRSVLWTKVPKLPGYYKKNGLVFRRADIPDQAFYADTP